MMYYPRLFLLWTTVLLFCSTTAFATAQPNFVLVMADDQGWGDVGYNRVDGDPVQTPVLDAMAETGLRLDRFYAAAPVCSPTRGSVLTGRHPNRFACFAWGHTLRPEETTIAEALGRAGYATGHFGKWHVGSVEAGSPVCPGNSGFDEWFSSPNFFDNSPLLSHRGQVIETKGESSMVTVEKALPFIRQSADAGKPFLAVIWFGSPHSPHEASQEMGALYPDEPKKRREFLGEVTGIDRAVGRLREELRKLNIADNTLLWYTSDNGALAEGSTGGLRGGKGNLYEGGIRVPAIIEWPARVATPRRSSVPCGTVDIYPTLLQLAGVDMPNQPKPLDGVSLVSLLDNKMQVRPRPMGFWVYSQRGHGTPSRKLLEQQLASQLAGNADKLLWPYLDTIPSAPADRYSEQNPPGRAAWIDGNFKLHRIPQKSGDVQFNLYDLASDPIERVDILDKRPDRARRMQTELAKWQKSVIGSLNGEDYK